jgi:hypothetical protein
MFYTSIKNSEQNYHTVFFNPDYCLETNFKIISLQLTFVYELNAFQLICPIRSVSLKITHKIHNEKIKLVEEGRKRK